MGYREVIDGEFSHSSRHSNLHQRCVSSFLSSFWITELIREVSRVRSSDA